MDTSRIDGVKAPQHRGTPGSDLIFFDFLAEDVELRFFGLLMEQFLSSLFFGPEGVFTVLAAGVVSENSS